MKEYIAYLDGSRIDNNGFKSNYGVTANTIKDAEKLLTKAKLHYNGSTKNFRDGKRIAFITRSK